MFKEITIQAVFFIAIGAILLVSGTTAVRRKRNFTKSGFLKDATVLYSKHVEKKDDSGYLLQNYYDVKIEYKENGSKKQTSLKSVDEYINGEKIKVYRDTDRGNKVRIYNSDKESAFSPYVLMAVGILIILMPFSQKKYGMMVSSLILATIIFLVGISLLGKYLKDKKREVEELEAKIVGIIKWNSSSEGRKKMFSTNSVSYYPVYEYCTGGKVRHMRGFYNSNQATTYKVGRSVSLYRDVVSGAILEKGPKKTMFFTGTILIIISVIGAVSAFMS